MPVQVTEIKKETDVIFVHIFILASQPLYKCDWLNSQANMQRFSDDNETQWTISQSRIITAQHIHITKSKYGLRLRKQTLDNQTEKE